MNALPVFARWLLDARRSLIGWAAGLALVAFLYLPMYSGMKATDLLGDKLRSLPTGMLDSFGMDALTMGTEWGYVHQTVFAMLGMLILLVLGISQGTRAIAGDEESGSLELTLAHATTRTSVLCARMGSVSVIVAAMAAFLLVMVAIAGPRGGISLPVGNLLAEGAALFLLVEFHALLAIAVGAWTGQRSVTLAVTSAVALVGWFVNNTGARLASWLPNLSPFHWAYGGQPLRDGADWGGLAALAIGCAVLAAASYLGFSRRDLRA